MTPDRLAAVLLDEALQREQSARRVPSDGDAEAVRRTVRRLARERDVRIRTARMADTVVVVLADAAIWSDDAATMRAKLTPRI